MKKLFLSIFAVATLFSCSKSDVIYVEEQSEIGFAPVAQNVTKSVAGYNGDTFDGVFPTDIDLYVFANVEDDVTTDNFNWSDPYFSNALFKHKAGGSITEVDNPGATNNKTATAGAYAGSPSPYYWPNVKSVIFAGVSKACNINDGAIPSMDFEDNELTIRDYVQDNDTYAAEGENDLMWFPYDGNSYTKQTNEIIANMKHACAWITIMVKGKNASDITVTPDAWVINDITINGLVSKGDVTCKYTKSDNTYTASTDWTLSEDEGDVKTYQIFDGSQPLTATAAKCETNNNNNTIVIPQIPTSIDIKYTYISQQGATNDDDDIYVTETKNVPLKLNDANTIKWQSGYHYIYTITFTATEILVDPVVNSWVEYTPAPEKNIQ